MKKNKTSVQFMMSVDNEYDLEDEEKHVEQLFQTFLRTLNKLITEMAKTL